MAQFPVIGVRPLMINMVKGFNFLCPYISKTFTIWFSGRAVFKTVRWTVKAIDENNQLNNITTSVVKSMPEPLLSVYKVGFYIYPDWDSNYARVGVVLQALSLYQNIKDNLEFKPILTTKGWWSFGWSCEAFVHEVLRDNFMVEQLKLIKNSKTEMCRYNISIAEKANLEMISAHSPEFYAITHVIGERILNPMVFSYLDGTPQALVMGFVTSSSYLAQDLTRFRLIERDIKAVLDYAQANHGCVYSLGNDAETAKTSGDTPEPTEDL